MCKPTNCQLLGVVIMLVGQLSLTDRNTHASIHREEHGDHPPTPPTHYPITLWMQVQNDQIQEDPFWEKPDPCSHSHTEQQTRLMLTQLTIMYILCCYYYCCMFFVLFVVVLLPPCPKCCLMLSVVRSVKKNFSLGTNESNKLKRQAACMTWHHAGNKLF